jgi:anti-anti-sigma factor
LDDEAVFWVAVRSEDGARIDLIGELDLAGAPLVDEQLLRAATSRSGAITIDLSGLTFCDLAGLRALDHARTAGAVLTGRVQDAVRRLLEATGRDALVPVERHEYATDMGERP